MAVWYQSFLRVALIVAILGVYGVRCDLAFSLRSCPNNGNRELLTFGPTSVSPYPIILPGDFSVTSSLRVFGNVTGDITLDVTVERRFAFFNMNVRIPCVGRVGSCRYTDVCGFLGRVFGNNAGCPPPMRRDGVPCTCPLSPGTYTMTNGRFSVPSLNSVWAWLAQGDYMVTAKLRQVSTGEIIACQRMDLTIAAPVSSCTSLFCRLFGG